ncbi:MAG: glycosyltransferase [Anaerorhabdus sp.]|uniref:glycosyltransferase n=1 Tax=Anaerorhabdus sp. TaxID=1872524 RepID=UPI002FCA786F
MNNEYCIFVQCNEKDARNSELKSFSYVKNLDNEIEIDGIEHSLDTNLIYRKRMEKEFFTQYYVWKNINLSSYGFMDSSKLISFSTEKYLVNDDGWIWFYFFDEECENKLMLNDSKIRSIIDKTDFIIIEPVNLKYNSVYDYYLKASPLHLMSDIDCLKKVVENLYPKDEYLLDEYLKGKIYYSDPLFVASKKIFNEYCEWIFSIILRLEEELDLLIRSKEGLESIHDLCMILFGVYCCKILKSKKNISINQRAFIEFNQQAEELKPVFSENFSTILLTSSDYYVPYCATTIKSILCHINPKTNYDLIILQQDISRNNMEKLDLLVSQYENVSLRFYDPRRKLLNYPGFDRICLDFGVTRFPPILAYRAFIPYLFPNYEKMLWLDCDLVVESDISELYKIDMNNKILGFVHDIVICAFANGSDPSYQKYYRDSPIMKDIYLYGNAGVVLLDLEKFRNMLSLDEFIKRSGEYKHMIPEQDTINCIFEGHTYFIDRRWNIITFASGPEWAQRFVPYEPYQEYLEAKKNPFIVHYVGPEKPWNNAEANMGCRFWYYAQMTEFYNIILQRQIEAIVKKELNQIKNTLEIIEPFAKSKDPNRSKLRKFIDFICPYGSMRRSIVKKIIPKTGSLTWMKMRKIYWKLIGKNE